MRAGAPDPRPRRRTLCLASRFARRAGLSWLCDRCRRGIAGVGRIMGPERRWAGNESAVLPRNILEFLVGYPLGQSGRGFSRIESRKLLADWLGNQTPSA